MVPFAGYSMPLSYGDVGQGKTLFVPASSASVDLIFSVAGHNHVRQKVGVFDVGHMVQSK